MAPYKAFYGRRYKTSVCWEEVGDKKLYGAKLIHVTFEKVRIIKDRMKVAQDRQKKYVDIRRKPFDFKVGDKVFLKVTPWKNLLTFGIKVKLALRYIGPFEIVKKVGPVVYKLYLPPSWPKCTMCSIFP
jgi:hypothetical protein